MLCDAEQFSHHMQSIDVRKTDEIILYDTNIMLGASRAFWTMKVFGCNVKVLNGPLQKWIAEGKPIVGQDQAKNVQSQPPRDKAGDEAYDFTLNEKLVFKFEEIEGNKDAILDARLKDNFDAGHIPKSVSVPFDKLLNQDRSFKSD